MKLLLFTFIVSSFSFYAQDTKNVTNNLINSKRLKKHNSSIEKSLTQQYDSIYNYKLDIGDQTLNTSFKTIDLVYNNNNDILSSLIQYWDGAIWNDSIQITNTYDTDYNLTYSLTEVYDGNLWINSLQISKTYDINNNLLTETRQVWNGSSWDNDHVLTYTYDSNNNKLSYLLQSSWNGSNWDWEFRTLSTYNIDNRVITENNERFISGNWINTYTDSYHYNSNNLVDTILETGGVAYGYQLTDTQARIVLIYNSEGLLTNSSFQNYYMNIYTEMYIDTYTYDTNSNLILLEMEYLDENNVFYLGDIFTWTYDSENVLIDYTYYYRTSNIGSYEGGDSIHYYYTSNLGFKGMVLDEHQSVIFPNPNNGKFTISCKTIMEGIEIFNITGNKVYANHNDTNSKMIEINTLEFDSGIYFVKVNLGNNQQVHKISIE